MRHAIEVAKANPRHPFGAVILNSASEVIVAEGVNRSSKNRTLHGEIDVINKYAASGEADWHRLTFYTTAEPCPMCMSAILWSGVKSIVYGTSIPTLVRLSWDPTDIRVTAVAAKSHQTNCDVIPGVLVSECDALFRKTADAGVGTSIESSRTRSQ